MPKGQTHRDLSAEFHEACARLSEILAGETRHEMLDVIGRARGGPAPALRSAIRRHRFGTASADVVLCDIVERFEGPARQEGFHILRTWDPQRHRFLTDITPALMVGFAERAASGGHPQSPAILLDCYFLFVIMLLAMRVWDTDEPSTSLRRVGALLAELQGLTGSGHQFVDDAPSLVSLAIAQYQPHEPAYDLYLERVKELDPQLRLSLALANASNFGSHLRWGRRYMYADDAAELRNDNVVDYPWVLETLQTLTRAGAEGDREAAAQSPTRRQLLTGIVNALSADPGAFLGEVPDVLAGQAVEQQSLRDVLERHLRTLHTDVVAARPTDEAYAPIALQFNFLHNVLTAKLALACDGHPAADVSLSVLLGTSEAPSRSLARSPEVLARLLAGFASEPHRREARGAPLIVYDPSWGREAVDRVFDFVLPR
jgi:hypothetical protein